jgi:cell division topological specificity factor
MGLLDFFKSKPKASADNAKNRLMILISHERAQRESPDYLPILKNELLAVIRKYVNVAEDAVNVTVHKDGNQEMLELSVTLPDRPN